MTTTLAAPTETTAVAVPEHWGLLALRFPPDWQLTDELLEEFGQLNPEWKLERGHHGELVVNIGSGGPSFVISAELLVALHAWTKERGGFACGEAASYTVQDPNGGQPMRNPDVSWVTAEQVADMGGTIPASGFWPVCPAFVVEVRSPADKLPNQQGRMEDWIRFGAQLGWLVDPQNRDIWIYRPDREPVQRDRPSVVEGDAPIDGFSFNFEPIWELVDQAEASAFQS